MPNLQDLRRRIRAVQSTRQITKAMKMVSAAKLRRAQERVVAARPYTVKMMQIFNDLTRRAPEYRHPLLGTSDEQTAEVGAKERILLALVTGDKGLCGPFNTNLIKRAQEFLREHQGAEVELAIIGRRGYDYFKRRPVKIRSHYLGITGSGRVSYADVQRITGQLISDFTNEEAGFDRVFLIYSEFKSALQQRPVLDQLLPVGTSVGENAAVANESLVEYLYEQPADDIFGAILPKLIETQVHRALLESVASEMGARMTAMESASKNADEVIDRLMLNMNRVRQASITREIIEVISGAGAL
jgi:F-type H+-transporting ATPase subunit gamma